MDFHKKGQANTCPFLCVYLPLGEGGLFPLPPPEGFPVVLGPLGGRVVVLAIKCKYNLKIEKALKLIHFGRKRQYPSHNVQIPDRREFLNFRQAICILHHLVHQITNPLIAQHIRLIQKPHIEDFPDR